MATAQTSPGTAAEPMRVAPAGSGEKRPGADKPGESKPMQALVPSPAEDDESGPELIRGPVARLPVELDVVVPVESFRVRNLLALRPGEVIESQWNYGEDVPLTAGDVQLAWSEFEVIDGQLAVRITRLPLIGE